MRIQYFYPKCLLAKYIKEIWVLETNPTDGDIEERVVPNGAIELIFHFKKTLNVEKGNGEKLIQPKSFISGLTSSFSDVSSKDEIGMIAVTFKPLGANLFFRFPFREIKDQAVSLDLLGIDSLDELHHKIDDVPTTAEKVNEIENFLLNRFNQTYNNDIALVKKGIDIIKSNYGEISTKFLSSALCTTPKTLERKFSNLTGKTPKQYAKITRFLSIFNSMMNKRNQNFIDLAIEKGYFDQAHFINDFKAFTGYSPKKFHELYCNT